MPLSSPSAETTSPTLIERAVHRLEQTMPEVAAVSLLAALGQVNGAPVAVKELDSGVYRFVNAPMASLFGCAADDVVGRTDAQLLSSYRAAALRAADQTAEAQHPQPSLADHRFEWRGQRLHYTALRVVVPDPKVPGRRLVATVWTDRGPANAQDQQLQALRVQLESDQRLIERLRRDGLASEPSGPSREQRVFDDQLRRELDLSARERREFTLVMVELDSQAVPEGVDPVAFREAAREALERLMMGSVRAMDTICRVSDDRFGVLLSGVGLATSHARAEGLRRQCAEYVLMVQAQACAFSVSVGLASFPHSARAKDDLMRSVAYALLQAHQRGGNQLKLAGMPFPRSGGLAD